MNNKLFRIWNPLLEGFVSDPSEWFINSEGHVYWYECGNGELTRARDCEINCWTGFYDKDGVPIYEKDIVSVEHPDNLFIVKLGIVSREVISYDAAPERNSYGMDICCFYFEKIGDPDKKCFSINKNKFGCHDLELTKVVGNVYNTAHGV